MFKTTLPQMRQLLHRRHIIMSMLIGPSVLNPTLLTRMPFVSILAAHVLESQDPTKNQEVMLNNKEVCPAKNVEAIIKSGTFEHQRCILLSVFSHPAICNIASSIGVNINDIHLGQQLLRSVTKLLKCATKTASKNHCVGKIQRNVIQAIGVTLMPTPTKDGNDNNSNNKKKLNKISICQISKQLGLTNGSGWKILTQGIKRREAIAKSNAQGWILINDDDKISK
jgi:hypothetical protein